jgi:hypothetical protein
MFRYLTEVLPDRHLQLSGLNELDEEDKRAVKASLPLIMPLMACSAMQACYVMIMTLYKVKSTLVAGDTSSDLSFLETERLVEELRYGVRDSLTMLKKYRVEFAHIGAMHEELKLVNQVAFVDVWIQRLTGTMSDWTPSDLEEFNWEEANREGSQ